MRLASAGALDPDNLRLVGQQAVARHAVDGFSPGSALLTYQRLNY
jgi:hypothetical protein